MLSGTLQLSTAIRCFAMGPPEAPRAVSVGLRNCYLALPRCHKLFLLGFETAIWHVAAFDGLSLLCHGSSRGPTSCWLFLYWASKLLSGTFSAPLKSFKTLKTLPAAFDCLRCFAMGPPEAPRAVSVGLRNCYLTLPKRHKMFLFGFATAIWHVAAFDGLSLLCHGSYRGPTSCFCWASKLLSGTSEAPQAVSIGLRNCYLAHFPHPLKPSKASKPSQQLSTAFRCFAIGFRNCYLATPRRHKLFLLGFKTAIWHVFSTPKTVKGLKTLPAAFDGLSLLCHGPSRGPTNCFCWASKLLSGTSEAPQAVSILGFETAIWHLFSTLKSLKTLKPLPAAFDGLRLLCHGTSQAPQAVSIGLRNCYLARCSFRRPFAALPWDIPRPTRHELFLLGFETPIWHGFSTP